MVRYSLTIRVFRSASTRAQKNKLEYFYESTFISMHVQTKKILLDNPDFFNLVQLISLNNKRPKIIT